MSTSMPTVTSELRICSANKSHLEKTLATPMTHPSKLLLRERVRLDREEQRESRVMIPRLPMVITSITGPCQTDSRGR